MNTVNLNDKRDFPLSTNALKFMQDAYSQLEQLAKLGGDNYILTGCTVTGASASSGWMVIGGKLVPFAGGTIQTNVKVVTTTTNIVVGSGNRDETVVTAEFGTSANPAENVEWALLNGNRIETLLSLKTSLASLSQNLSVINLALVTTKRMVLEIGVWNMDADAFKEVNIPGLVASQIVSINAVIIDDLDYSVRAIDFYGDGASAGHIYAYRTNPDPQLKARISRTTSGFFDSIFFQTRPTNRGYVYIIYRD